MSTASIVDLKKSNDSVAQTLVRFTKLFNNLSAGNIGDIVDVYTKDVEFQDPFSKVTGLDSLANYFKSAYGNVLDCRFDFEEPVISGNNICIAWTMRLNHKRIRNGSRIDVDGISQLTIREGKVARHRDYFDVGQLLYENLPILGKAIRWIRSQAG